MCCKARYVCCLLYLIVVVFLLAASCFGFYAFSPLLWSPRLRPTTVLGAATSSSVKLWAFSKSHFWFRIKFRPRTHNLCDERRHHPVTATSSSSTGGGSRAAELACRYSLRLQSDDHEISIAPLQSQSNTVANNTAHLLLLSSSSSSSTCMFNACRRHSPSSSSSSSSRHYSSSSRHYYSSSRHYYSSSCAEALQFGAKSNGCSADPLTAGHQPQDSDCASASAIAALQPPRVPDNVRTGKCAHRQMCVPANVRTGKCSRGVSRSERDLDGVPKAVVPMHVVSASPWASLGAMGTGVVELTGLAPDQEYEYETVWCAEPSWEACEHANSSSSASASASSSSASASSASASAASSASSSSSSSSASHFDSNTLCVGSAVPSSSSADLSNGGIASAAAAAAATGRTFRELSANFPHVSLCGQRPSF